MLYTQNGWHFICSVQCVIDSFAEVHRFETVNVWDHNDDKMLKKRIKIKNRCRTRVVRKCNTYLSCNIIPKYLLATLNNIDLPLDYTSTNTHARITANRFFDQNTGWQRADDEVNTTTEQQQQKQKRVRHDNAAAAAAGQGVVADWQQQCDWATVSQCRKK